MENISIYLNPISKASELLSECSAGALGLMMNLYDESFPDLEGMKIAFIGVNEGRDSLGNEGCAHGAQAVRKHLYKLFLQNDQQALVDLGDIKAGHTVEDTLFAVEQVCFDLLQRGIVPIFIGGADYCSLAMYKAYCRLERLSNVVAIDSIFDLNDSTEAIHSENHLSRLILHKPGFLFNYSNLGYQTYLVNEEMSITMKKMFFDVHRLGELRGDIIEAEPIIRNADMMTIDMRSIRAADSPGHARALPNGFSGEQLCQMAAFAGMNEKLTSIGFFELNPEYDPHGLSAQLLAQAVWCFADGFFRRHPEDIRFDSDQFTRYRVPIKDDHEIIFFKSKVTDRWWLEVPYPASETNRYRRSHLIPCTYKDYQDACEQEVPDKWLQTFQKLS